MVIYQSYIYKLKLFFFIFKLPRPSFFLFQTQTLPFETMDPSLERTPDLPVWLVVAPEARVPHSFDLDPDQDIPLTPSL